MATLTERMHMKFGFVSDAHFNIHASINYYEQLCFICAELNVDLSNVSDCDFDSAVSALEQKCKSANEETGFAVSVWFD